MIESIELVNWKTHKNTVMRFQKGVNVLIGVMGAGKSSVMDALSFGLFGTFPALTHKRTSTKDLISSRPTLEDNAEVKITFSVGKDRYTISRKLSKKESTVSRIEKNGEYLQTQTERVNEEIAAVLKVDYDTFSRAIYSEQNRLDYFLELAKGERKHQIDEMLGLDSFARAEENATSLVNSLRNTIKDAEQTLSQLDVSKYRKELEQLTSQRNDIAEDIKKMSAAAKSLKVDVEKLEAKLSEAKTSEKKRELMLKELEGMKSRFELLQREIEKIVSPVQNIEEIKQTLEHGKVASEKYSKDSKDLKVGESASMKLIARTEAELKLLESRLVELEKLKVELERSPLEKLQTALKALQDDLDNTTRESSIAEGKRAEELKAIFELEKHISKCPICERELSGELRASLTKQKSENASRLEKEHASLKSKMAELREKIKSSRTEAEKISVDSKKFEEYPETKLSISKLREKLESEKASHENILSQLNETTSALEKLTKEINLATNLLESVKRRDGYVKELSIVSEGMKIKNKELAMLGDRSKEIDELHKAHLNSSKSLSDAESKIESGTKFIKSVDIQIEERAKSIAKISGIEERLSRMRTQVASINKFKAALIDTESALRNRLVHSINSLMHEIWQQIYPYGDYTAIRLNAGKDDYSLEVATSSNEGPAWNDINGMASGGERSIGCLAMRIALSMVIVPNLRWLILDEPTHNIDENGIGKLVHVLGESLPSIVEQVFIITHDSALRNISGARIYQLDRNKAKNEYTSYSEL